MADARYDAVIGADSTEFTTEVQKAVTASQQYEQALSRLQARISQGDTAYQKYINGITGVYRQTAVAQAALKEMQGTAAASAEVFRDALAPGAAAVGGYLANSASQVARMKQLMLSTTEDINRFGITASLAGRKFSALLDESVAGRWRQFDGTLLSVLGQMASVNSTTALMTGGLLASAGAVAFLVYRWEQLNQAIENTKGEMFIAQNLSPGSSSRINQWVTQLREQTNLSQSDVVKLIERLGSLHGAAAQFGDSLLQIAIAQTQLNSGNADQYVKQLVDAFNQGGSGALKWAESLGFVTEDQKEQIKTLADEHHDTAAMNLVLDIARQKWADQGVQIAKTTRDLRAYGEMIASMGMAGGGAFLLPPPPAPPKLPENQTPVDQVTEERVAVVNKYSEAIRKRAELTADLNTAEDRLIDLTLQGAAGTEDYRRAQEAVANLSHLVLQTHTREETDAHQATLTRLQSELAADKDYADRRVADLQQIYEEQVRFNGEASNQAREARAREQAGERQLQDTKLRMHLEELTGEQNAARDDLNKVLQIEDEKLRALEADGKKGTEQYAQEVARRQTIQREVNNREVEIQVQGLRDQITAAQGNFAQQKALEDQILAMYKQHYGERSLKYQEESRKRTKMDVDEHRQAVQLEQEDARTQIQVMRTLESAQLSGFQRMQFRRGQFPSLLTMLGGQDQTAEFKAQLAQITNDYTMAMGQLRAAQHNATNPQQLAQALNQQAVETAKYTATVERLHQQAALQTMQAWDRVFRGMESSMNRSLSGMLIGTETVQQGMLNIFESLLSTFINIPLQMLEAWINGEIEKWLFTDTSEAAGRAAQAAGDIASIQSSAAVAAAGAYAATAAIPYVGPALAPGAAATAYADTSAFSTLVAFDEGAWSIPRTMVGVLHEGETVVPQRFAEGLRSSGALDDEHQRGGGNTHVTLAANIQALDGRSVLSILNEHMPNLARSLARHLGLNPSNRPKR